MYFRSLGTSVTILFKLDKLGYFCLTKSSLCFLSGFPYDGGGEWKGEFSQRCKWNIVFFRIWYPLISTKISWNYFIFYFTGSFTDRKFADCCSSLQKQNSENNCALFHSEHGYIWFNNASDIFAIGDKWGISWWPLVNGRTTWCSSCKLIWFAWDLSACVSILSMMGTAADRFYAVLSPMKSALFSRNKRRLIIAATWVVSVTFQVPYLYTVEIVSNANGNYCDIRWDPASYKFEVFRTNSILVFCLTAVSAVVITVLYSSILFFLYRRKNNLDLGTEVIRRRVKINQQITRMLVIIVAAFYIVWTPFYVVYYIISFMHSIKISCFYFSFCSNLPLLYPVVNPVVYYIFNANYRQGFRELLCCPWPCSTKCNDCFHSSTSPEGENNVDNAGQVNNAMENIELQEHR